MTIRPCPLKFTDLLARLKLLECYIPVVPAAGTEFIIFRWRGSSGTDPEPSGPVAFLKSREDDELCPVFEIQKLLRHLTLTADQMWDSGFGLTKSGAE